MQNTGIPVPSRHGLLRVVTNTELSEADAAKEAELEAENEPSDIDDALAAHIRGRMQDMRNFRNTQGIADRLTRALRAYRGEYDPSKLQDIKAFGGSEVYARLVTAKCRGATAILRDIFLGAERPWDILPTPVPTIPDSIEEAIESLIQIEVTTMLSSGEEIDAQMIDDRRHMLRKAAERAAKKQAMEETSRAKNQVDDLLVEGGYYTALAHFLTDLPIFPFACIKGPVVRNARRVKWEGGRAEVVNEPRMFWYRVSPFDLYWSPSAANVHEAEFIERIRLSRADLLALRGLPGTNEEAITEILSQYTQHGFRDWWDTTDQTRADLEERERWPMTSNNLIDSAEFTGMVSGTTLLEWGMTEEEVTDPIQEYRVVAWMVDRWVIRAFIDPTPSQRPLYYISSYEQIPGGLSGEGLPDLLRDLEDVCNATLRSLVNNLSISSGPQVVINDEVLQPGEDDQLYPWKRWHVAYDPMQVASGTKPVDFFQPDSNAQTLMQVYERFSQIADDVSALPRYMMGNERVGGAGRTASGLAMLMGNASKTLQNVAAAIDRDVIGPSIEQLYEYVMLSMPGMFRGDEEIEVRGVDHAAKREQDRMRQLEFLQLTANPIDSQIVGEMGRANILRAIATELGLEHELIVPDDETLKAQAEARQQAEEMAAAAEAGGAPGGAPGGMPEANQIPAPEPGRAGPENVRLPIENEFTNRATGRPGMRAGG